MCVCMCEVCVCVHVKVHTVKSFLKKIPTCNTESNHSKLTSKTLHWKKQKYGGGGGGGEGKQKFLHFKCNTSL